MVDRKIILDAYKKGPEAVMSLFEETFSKLEKRIQELEHASFGNKFRPYDYVLSYALYLFNTSLHHEPVKGYCIRQVYDLPPIQIEVTEHKVEQKECPHCHSIQESKFPSTVSHLVQYGPNIKRLIPYLTHYQWLSLKRTKEFFQDCFGHSISEGTLVNHTNSFSAQLQPFLQEVKDKILPSPVVHLMKPVCE